MLDDICRSITKRGIRVSRERLLEEFRGCVSRYGLAALRLYHLGYSSTSSVVDLDEVRRALVQEGAFKGFSGYDGSIPKTPGALRVLARYHEDKCISDGILAYADLLESMSDSESLRRLYDGIGRTGSQFGMRVNIRFGYVLRAGGVEPLPCVGRVLGTPEGCHVGFFSFWDVMGSYVNDKLCVKLHRYAGAEAEYFSGMFGWESDSVREFAESSGYGERTCAIIFNECKDAISESLLNAGISVDDALFITKDGLYYRADGEEPEGEEPSRSGAYLYDVSNAKMLDGYARTLGLNGEFLSSDKITYDEAESVPVWVGDSQGGGGWYYFLPFTGLYAMSREGIEFTYSPFNYDEERLNEYKGFIDGYIAGLTNPSYNERYMMFQGTADAVLLQLITAGEGYYFKYSCQDKSLEREARCLAMRIFDGRRFL